jgi:hypothetical protein
MAVPTLARCRGLARNRTAHSIHAVTRHVPGVRTHEQGAPERVCRVCGCTDLRACAGGCWWVGEDLCSACQPKGDL